MKMNLKQKKQILFGIMLGDGNLQTYTGGKTWRIRFLQGHENKEYLFELYSIFKEYVSTPPKRSWLKSGHSRWSFNTTVQALALEFSKMFYCKNRKIVPSKENLDKYLTPLALAFWFMDDGSLKSNCWSYYLCTDNFSLDELKIIRLVFKEKYDIGITFHKQRLNYRIYIPRSEAEKFYNLIEKYIYISMRYKLNH